MTPWQFLQHEVCIYTSYSILCPSITESVCIKFTCTTEEEEDGGDYSTGELVGAVVATFFITLLLYTVIMVIVFIGVLKFQRKRYCKLHKLLSIRTCVNF